MGMRCPLWHSREAVMLCSFSGKKIPRHWPVPVSQTSWKTAVWFWWIRGESWFYFPLGWDWEVCSLWKYLFMNSNQQNKIRSSIELRNFGSRELKWDTLYYVLITTFYIDNHYYIYGIWVTCFVVTAFFTSGVKFKSKLKMLSFKCFWTFVKCEVLSRIRNVLFQFISFLRSISEEDSGSPIIFVEYVLFWLIS